MSQLNVAIIGGGIVGSTAAFYLAKNNISVTLFDTGIGQATKAAAGIICPWFTLRRNRPWYFLVSNGAEFYRQLISDLEELGYNTQPIFQEQGTLIIRKNEKSLQRDLLQAEEKQLNSPSIQEVKTIRHNDYAQLFPLLNTSYDASWIKGGARVDGEALINTLQHAFVQLGGKIIREEAHLSPNQTIHSSSFSSTSFDRILLASGAWLPQLLTPLGFQVDIRPQKGQLFTLKQDDWCNQQWPVIMPPGKVDIIPDNNGNITIGATHEDDQGYDLTLDNDKLETLRQHALEWLPSIQDLPIASTRVGIRAYTSDYAVLLGQVPHLTNVWAVSGLGSSGLTSGPYIGYQWSKLVCTGSWDINEADYPIERYIQKLP